MKILSHLVTSLIIAFWLIVISLFSIQNIAEISLKFFWLESIKFPVGVMLSLATGLGMILGAILPILLLPNKKAPPRKPRPRLTRNLETEGEDPIFDWE
jgi:uncharacterized integral membrane protein